MTSELSNRKSHRGYRFGLVGESRTADLDLLIEYLERPTTAGIDPLNGRVDTDRAEVSHWGNVVIKHYVRGGWMRHITHRNHLRSRTSRAETEFRILQSLQADGLPVPRPLAWVERGRIFVHKWLIMDEVPSTQTLAQVVRHSPDQARALLPAIEQLIEKLIEKRVHHVDLHPGNVLVDAENQIHLIDFDKGTLVDFTPADLRERYQRRWNRAVTKHKLSTGLIIRSHPPGAAKSALKTRRAPLGIQSLVCLSDFEPLVLTLPFLVPHDLH